MHEHSECKHDLKYCSNCDTVWCTKCKKEWTYSMKFTFTPYISDPNYYGNPNPYFPSPTWITVCNHAD